MTSSGTYTAVKNFNIIEIIDEAFRRCRLTPMEITAEHLLSARISLDMMFISWINDGVSQFSIDSQTQTLLGDSTDISFTMPAGSVDVISAVFRNANATDMVITAIGRQDYQYLTQKTTTGQPINYFVDKAVEPPVVYLWPVQNITGTSVVYNRIRQIQDVGNYTNTPNVTVLFKDVMCAGLAARLAEKYCEPDMEQRLVAKYEVLYNLAKDQDRDRARLVIKPRLGRRW